MKTFTFGSVNLYIILFRHVSNTKQLRKMLFKGELECALIKPTLICDPLQIAAAGAKALLWKSNSKMITKNLYTETLFNLSVSKNITQSLQTFGVSDSDSDIALAHYGNEVSLAKVIENIGGVQVDWSELDQIRKVQDINDYYNIKNEESLMTCIRDSVVTRIAIKNLD